MKVEQLEQLIKIVESGSMNEAAKDLYLARSSLSTSIKNLEDELGGGIFSRHSKGVSLTPFGATVYNQACEICSRIRYLQRVSIGDDKKRLSIASMYCSMANDAFAVLLSEHIHERLEASIEEFSLSQVIESVREGLCEIGIITLFSDSECVTLRKLADENLEYHEIAQRTLGAMVGPRNPLYHTELSFINLKDLCNYPHLENYATPTDHAWEHRVLPAAQYRGRYVVSDLGLALRLVADTDAVMIDAHDREIYHDLYAKSDYKFIPINDYPRCKTGWIKCKGLELSPIAEKYIEILTD